MLMLKLIIRKVIKVKQLILITLFPRCIIVIMEIAKKLRCFIILNTSTEEEFNDDGWVRIELKIFS